MKTFKCSYCGVTGDAYRDLAQTQLTEGDEMFTDCCPGCMNTDTLTFTYEDEPSAPTEVNPFRKGDMVYHQKHGLVEVAYMLPAYPLAVGIQIDKHNFRVVQYDDLSFTPWVANHTRPGSKGNPNQDIIYSPRLHNKGT